MQQEINIKDIEKAFKDFLGDKQIDSYSFLLNENEKLLQAYYSANILPKIAIRSDYNEEQKAIIFELPNNMIIASSTSQANRKYLGIDYLKQMKRNKLGDKQVAEKGEPFDYGFSSVNKKDVKNYSQLASLYLAKDVSSCVGTAYYPLVYNALHEYDKKGIDFLENILFELIRQDSQSQAKYTIKELIEYNKFCISHDLLKNMSLDETFETRYKEVNSNKFNDIDLSAISQVVHKSHLPIIEKEQVIRELNEYSIKNQTKEYFASLLDAFDVLPLYLSRTNENIQNMSKLFDEAHYNKAALEKMLEDLNLNTPFLSLKKSIVPSLVTNRAKKYVSTSEEAIKQEVSSLYSNLYSKQQEKIEQNNFHSENNSYVNEKKYIANCPYGIRFQGDAQRKQFVCWTTEYQDNALKDKNGVLILDESGNKTYHQKKDRVTKELMFDENGQPIWDEGYHKKIPINPRTGTKAMSNNPSTWGTFDEACKAVDQFNLKGIGIMLDRGLIGIDVDNIRNENGELTDEAIDIIKSVNSYTEYSPSKTGIHILAFADLPEGRRRKGNVEIYQKGRFFTLTGDIISKEYRKIPKKIDTNDAVKEIHKKYVADDDESKRVNITSQQFSAIYDNETENNCGLSDDEIIHKCMISYERRRGDGVNRFESLYYGKESDWRDLYPGNNADGGDHSAGDYALLKMMKFYTTSPSQLDRLFRSSNMMRPKWDKLLGQETYGVICLRRIFAENSAVYGGNKEKNDALEGLESNSFRSK